MTIRSFGPQSETAAPAIQAVSKASLPVLHYNVDYDSSHPEEVIRSFVAQMKSMVIKYDTNKSRIQEIESELVDLYHYIEIAANQKVTDGYKLYRRMAELRRERRACKNENDLLWPVYQYFHATDVLPKLANVQGEVAKVQSAIDMRVYSVRTDALNEYLKTESADEVKEEK